jgi:hypothetical protein
MVNAGFIEESGRMHGIFYNRQHQKEGKALYN